MMIATATTHFCDCLLRKGTKLSRPRGLSSLTVLADCLNSLLVASFINLFAIVVASFAFATSTTFRKDTFCRSPSLCRCPFPINLTRICSDTKPAIN